MEERDYAAFLAELIVMCSSPSPKDVNESDCCIHCSYEQCLL
jgi:hypothetical protein